MTTVKTTINSNLQNASELKTTVSSSCDVGIRVLSSINHNPSSSTLIHSDFTPIAPYIPTVSNEPTNPPIFIGLNPSSYQIAHVMIATVNDVEVDIDAVQISLNADSWAWNFSCHLTDPDQLSLFNATGCVLRITIHGYDFDFLVENKNKNDEFEKTDITLSGRSLTAELSTPYFVPTSDSQQTMLSISQLVDKQLPSNWAFDWQCETWVVPAGAYSYSNQTPIEVIADIASKIGAIVVPSRTGRYFEIKPRYPVLPWDFEKSVPEISILEHVITSVTYRNVTPSQANAIYIQGSEIGGVLAYCVREGSAGDRTLASISNSLMTSPVAARALASRVLAGQHEQPKVKSITLPFSIKMPLIMVGKFVAILIDGDYVTGIVNSVSISADLASAKQTITIGEETQNVWSAFKDLLPSHPLLVGKLLTTNGVTSELKLHDKSKVRVRGTGTVDKNYYFRAGIIENEAPNLVLSEIVI